MKSISTELRDHLDGTVTSLTSIWRLTRRDGEEFYFTDHDVDIVFDDGDGSATYKSNVGYDRTSLVSRIGLSVDSMDVEGLLNSEAISQAELRAGLFDYAEVRVSLVNWKDLTQGELKLKRGRLGEVTISHTGTFRAELRSLSQHLSQNIIETYSAECRADLGDSKCRVTIRPDVLPRSTAVEVGEFYRVATASGDFQSAYENRVYEVTTAGTTDSAQPTYDTDVGATTTDGTAVLTARDSLTRHATIASVVDDLNVTITVSDSKAVDDWFNGGALIFEEGDNSGVVREIVDWVQSSGRVTTFLPFPATPVVGQRVRVYPGCDKRLSTCRDRFDNVLNFRGEPFIPGPDQTTGIT